MVSGVGGCARGLCGAAPPASRVLRIALRATVHRAALDPGDHCGPWGQEQGAGQGLPPREARVQPLLGFGKQLLVEALRLDE